MTQLSPYRMPAPRPPEVLVRRWVIKEPFTRSMVRMDITLLSCWLFCTIIDVIRLAAGPYPWGWGLLALHVLCVIGWGANLWMKVERRTETKQITE